MDNKTLTQKLLSFAEREINVFAGDHAGRNLEASLKQARMLSNLFRSVYYLNTSHNPWAFTAMIRQIFGTVGRFDVKRFECLSHLDGKLARKFEDLKHEISCARASILIINSWEFTSRNYRLRDDLVFMLRQLVLEYNLTVIVWSQRGISCVAGEWKHGLGRLAATAAHVEDIARILKPEAEAPPQEAVPVEGTIRLFAEYQIIDDDGNVIPQEPKPAIEAQEEQVSETLSISPVGAIVKASDLDPMTLDLTPVCANASTRDFKNLRGENWCPWENMSDEEALAIMPHVGNPFSSHFAPLYWGSAFYRLKEYPKECPPLPLAWYQVYQESVWFRELVRQAGFSSLAELEEAERETKHYKPKPKGEGRKQTKIENRKAVASNA